jgi:predicted  nucleic acid-binding Zn-ribbon protein
MNNTNPEITICEECGSTYFESSSEMLNLCSECTHRIYDYPPCIHKFINGRCSKCNWDGSESDFTKKLKQEKQN